MLRRTALKLGSLAVAAGLLGSCGNLLGSDASDHAEEALFYEELDLPQLA